MRHRRGACTHCKACARRDITTLGLALFIWPTLLVLHVMTFGMAYLCVKRCPICRHRVGRHHR